MEGSGSPDVYPTGANIPVPQARPESTPVPVAAGVGKPANPNETGGGAVATPAAEAPIAVSPEQQAEIELQRGKSLRMIAQAQKEGMFKTPQARSAAELAIQSGGQDTKVVLAALKSAGEYVVAANRPTDESAVATAYNVLSENFEITSSDGKTYKLSDLETERSDPNTTKERRAEIERIIEGGLTVELTPGEAIDQAVGEQIASLTAKIAEAEKAGRDVRKEKEILGLLRLAQGGGTARHAIGMSGLMQLKNSGVSGLDSVINQGANLFTEQYNMIHANFLTNSYSEQEASAYTNMILRGEIMPLLERGVLGKSGVDILLLGKNLSDSELQETLKSMFSSEEAEALWKKHGKNAALAILILIAMGVYPNVKKMLIPGS